MNKLFVAVSLFISSIALADGGCVALQKFVGLYKQTSKSCDTGWYGPTLTVSPYIDERSPITTGYWLTSASDGFGPTDMNDGRDLDKCFSQGNDLKVEICGYGTDSTCLPRKGRVSYVFSDSQVNFIADGCSAIYVRQ